MQKNLARAGMAAVALIGAIALILFAMHISRIAGRQEDPVRAILGRAEDEDRPDIEDRQEVITIYATQGMLDFAKSRDIGAHMTREELGRLLDQGGVGDHWLVSVNRVDFKSRRFEHRPVIAKPGRHDYRLPTDQELMQMLAGKMIPGKPDRPEVIVFPDRLLKELGGLKPEEAWERLQAETAKR